MTAVSRREDSIQEVILNKYKYRYIKIDISRLIHTSFVKAKIINKMPPSQDRSSFVLRMSHFPAK